MRGRRSLLSTHCRHMTCRRVKRVARPVGSAMYIDGSSSNGWSVTKRNATDHMPGNALHARVQKVLMRSRRCTTTWLRNTVA